MMKILVVMQKKELDTLSQMYSRIPWNRGPSTVVYGSYAPRCI